MTEYGYNASGLPVTLKMTATADGKSRTTSIEYDSFGYASAMVLATGQRYGFQNDASGNVTAMVLPDGRTWTYEYDGLGKMKSAKSPSGRTTSFEYNATGKLASITKPGGAATSYEYDARGRVTKITGPTGEITQRTYNSRGDLASESDASGMKKDYLYELNKLVKMSDAEGQSVELDYTTQPGCATCPLSSNDPQPTSVKYPTWTTNLNYDRDGNIAASKDVTSGQSDISSKVKRDAAGRITELENADGKVSFYEYDSLGRMTKYTDPDSGQTIYKYNAFGDLLSVTDPKGQTTNFEHDDAGRITKEIRPMGQALVYDYDESGRLESATAPDARKKLYSYDLDDRLESVRYFAPSSGSPEKTITFTYNAAGIVESWNDGTISGSYEYDVSGRKTKETVNYGAFSKEFIYEYHKNGQKKSFTDSESRQYSYSWDKAGRLEAINLPTGATVSYTNMVMAGPEQINLPGGAYQKISHDGFMRLSGQKSFAASGDSSGSNTFERNYTRTGTGNITKVSGSDGDFVYGYDFLDRLVSSDAPGTAVDENFAYDKAGNRVFASNVNGPIAHNSNNQTTQYGADSFEYDTNGNTIKMIRGGKTLNLTWDGENRLVKVEEGGAVIATYGYDPFGRRLWKDAKGVKTFFLYSDEGLVGEFDASGNEIKSYGWKPNSTWGTDPVFMQKSGQYYFYHNDHLGTPRMMTSVTGNVVWKAEYEAFGKADVTVGVIENNLRFPGQYFDSETGLHYNWNRYYEPGVGRYVSEDPIGLEGGLNVYGYVGSNSMSLYDPEGLSPEDRVNWARNELKNNSNAWAAERRWLGLRGTHWKCNEFVYADHVTGDPDVNEFPTVLRSNSGYYKPTVNNLADPCFAPESLSTLDYKDVQPGDILVWYNPEEDRHHTAIYIGNDEAIYAARKGLKQEKVDYINNYYHTSPIVRRYNY